MRVVMMGTGEFAEPTFDALLASGHEVAGLVTNPDRPAGKHREMLRGMKKIALARNVPVFQPESINTPEGVAGLAAFRPELLVVAAYGQILSNEVLSVPPLGGVNVHASLLPKYRGAAPINWAIYHGETKTGVTIIRMSVSLDAGDMLAQEATDILPDENAGALEVRLAPLGARLALDIVNRLQAGPVDGQKQDKSHVTKAPKQTKAHGLIDWNRSAEQVANQIRAMQPWPTAYTFLHRANHPPLRVIVFRTGNKIVAPSGADHPPAGSVLGLTDNDHLWLATGANTGIALAELQPSGKKRMSAADFLRGHPLEPGAHFGPESA
ncbi:MAG: methionyl-tRNA formyltransferase [Gemmataceae bacterium]